MRRTVAIAVLALVVSLRGAPAPAPTPIDVTVHEGTSMSVAVSPDGRTLAIDLQGSIWTLPAAGGAATRITDLFNDARQPTWSPDGKWITFFAYRDGGYDIWAIAPDGAQSAQAHVGRRSTIASRSGRTTARASRSRPIAATRSAATTTSGSLDIAQRRAASADESAVRRLHADLVARRQGDRVRVDARRWAVGVGRERGRRHRAQGVDRGAVASTRRRGGRAVRSCITSRRPGQSRFEVGGKPVTGSENVFAFRASWAVADRVLLRLGRQDPQARARRRRRADGRFHRDAAGDARADRVHAPQARLHVDRAAPGARHRAARRSRPTASRSRSPRSATST